MLFKIFYSLYNFLGRFYGTIVRYLLNPLVVEYEMDPRLRLALLTKTTVERI